MKDRSEWLKEFEPNKVDMVQGQKIMHIQNSFKELIKDVLDHALDCDHRDAALRKLLEAKMLSVQAITHGKGAGQ